MKEIFNKSIGLSIFRVIVAFLVIKKAIFLLPMANELFGLKAISPYVIYLQSMSVYHLKFLAYPFHVPHAPQLFLMAIMLVASFYLFGVYKGITGVVLFIMITILRLRNGFILDGSDNVIQVTLPFLIFADSYKHFRLDFKFSVFKKLERFNIFNKNETIVDLRRFIANAALFGLMFQVCYVYFFTALAKLQGEMWLNGTAIYYTMRVEEFRATAWNIPLTENHYFVVLGTYFTIMMELAFIFLVWSRTTKFYVLILGVLLHVGIWIFMRIDDFSWIMIGTYFVFITDDEYRTFSIYLNAKKEIINLKFMKMVNSLTFKRG
jgi:hypothetical protein